MASANRTGIISQGRPRSAARTRTAKPVAAHATRIPRAMRTLSWEACLRLAFVRSIFLGAARERRLPTAPLMKVAKRSQQMVASAMTRAGGGHEVELNAAAVHAEGVGGEDGDAEDGVGDGDRKDEVAETIAGA